MSAVIILVEKKPKGFLRRLFNIRRKSEYIMYGSLGRAAYHIIQRLLKENPDKELKDIK